MATIVQCFPESAHFPSSNFAPLVMINRRPALAFDAGTVETVYWTFIAPTQMSGALTAKIHYIMASATTGTVDWEVALEAVTPGDATDLDAGTSFDTLNSASGTVPGTAGYEQVISVTLTNADSIAVGDLVRISLNRDADDAGANDSATGDAYVLGIEIQDAT
jgi:hypothetical protein